MFLYFFRCILSYYFQLRRTSSLQLPNEINKSKFNTSLGMFVSALSSIKNSTLSMYASTISAVGLIDNRFGGEPPINFYEIMNQYRCCFGFCKLRVASVGIGVFSCLYPTIVMVLWYYLETRGHINAALHFSLPALLFLTFKVIASGLLLIGIQYHQHVLLIPFLFSLVSGSVIVFC